MKKYFFFALATAGLLSSCSSDDSVVTGTEVEPTSELVPIQLGVGGAMSLDETRGTGTVGGYEGTADNKWNKQNFYVYMFEKGSVNLAKFQLTPESTPVSIFENEEFIAPDGADTGIATAKDDSVKYYPIYGNYDFYAYYLGNQTNTTQPKKDGDKYVIDFTIDGSQDIMVAKAQPSNDEINVLNAADANNGANRFYSSFAARNGVQPTLNFKHLLTRLTFSVEPKTASNIVVDAIKIVSPKTKGTLTIAAKGDNKGDSQTITWDENSPAELALMERSADPTEKDLQPLTNLDLSGKTVNVEIPIGEALLLPAEEEQYTLKVYTHQTINRGSTSETFEFIYEGEIKKPVNVSYKPFTPQGSYNVKISLWGINDITISTSLTPWVQAKYDVTFEPEATR